MEDSSGKLRSLGSLAGSLLLAACSLSLAAGVQAQETKGSAKDCPQSMRYVFSWSMENNCGFAPRGGTSAGADVTLDPEPHPGWLALQEEGLSDKERDRRAILAMAGPYRTSFEFLETVGYTPDFERARPYQSWGTEYIYVVEDSEDFISLQHIMVMFVKGGDGETMGPFVQKHWRQDWRYEKPEMLVYAGQDTWEKREVSEAERAGTWAQSVFQVDDSPRYESYGKWEHHPNFSTWRSALTWRPLPRRESSVRDDYDVLEGWNRHSITPEGWVHEEENYKVDLTESGAKADMPYLAKELGVNRYERVVDFDWSAGDEYWQATSPYWEDVRAVWEEVFAEGDAIVIREESGGVPLFAALFEQAEAAASGDYDSQATKARVREILEDYVSSR